MTVKLQSNGFTFTCTGVVDASDGHDRYWLVQQDDGEPIEPSRLTDALIELFYQPSNGAGSQYCTYFNRYYNEFDLSRCVVSAEWRYDV